MDYSKAIDSVADTLNRAGNPMTEAQKMLMAGAMAVWLDKAVTEERESCAVECERMMMFPRGREESFAHHGVEAAAKAIRERSNKI